MLIGRKPKIGLFLAPIYDIIQGFAIRKTKVVFAAASQKAVDDYNLFLKRIGTRTQVVALPTSVDMNTFRPQPQNKARKALSIPVSRFILMSADRPKSKEFLSYLMLLCN